MISASLPHKCYSFSRPLSLRTSTSTTYVMRLWQTEGRCCFLQPRLALAPLTKPAQLSQNAKLSRRCQASSSCPDEWQVLRKTINQNMRKQLVTWMSLPHHWLDLQMIFGYIWDAWHSIFQILETLILGFAFS